jgi:CheY-like chemotaxis protein
VTECADVFPALPLQFPATASFSLSAAVNHFENQNTQHSKQEVDHSFVTTNLLNVHSSLEDSLACPDSVPSVSKVAPSSSPSTLLHILLADDSPAILKMTSVMLRKCGYTVTTAANGAIAVKLVEESLSKIQQQQESQRQPGLSLGSFDFILLDLQMPVMDGLEAMKRIRDLERDFAVVCPSVAGLYHKIIGLSANADEETSQQVDHMGADGFLAKPWKMDELVCLIAELQQPK